MRNSVTLFRARITPNNAAYIDGTTIPASEAACAITTRPLDLQLWHECLCHHNSADIQKLISNGLATGITLSSSVKRDPICEPWLAGKMHSSPFPSTGHRASAPLELIHSDLCGPLSVSTPEGYCYWCVFIDDHTRYRVVVLFKRKSDTFNVFKLFKVLAENQLGRKIKALHDDKGGEYMSNEFNSFCDDSGILRTHTACNRPQQNGDAERANRTMLEDVTAMLAQANLPVCFWGRCLATQVKVWNCLLTVSLPDKTPFEVWFGRKPDLSCFRVFGCTAYVFIQKDKRKKLESHMQKCICIFVGYPPDYSAWTFYNPVTKEFIISECAEFDERVFPGLSTKETTPSAQLRLLETPASQMAPPNAIPLSIAPEDSDASQMLLQRLNTLPTPPVANSNPPSPAAPPAPTPFLDLPPAPPAVPPPAPQPPAPLVPPAPPAIPRQSQRKVKKPGEWWKVPRPAARPYEHPQRAPSLTPDPIPASPPPAAPVVLPEPAPAPQLVPPPVDNWEPRHPSPTITDSDDSDNDLGGYAEVHAVQVGGDPRTFGFASSAALGSSSCRQDPHTHCQWDLGAC
ncbi:hypothetical protein EST38_g7549 [Candolleomyces aberdarensis]|uniref:Integrase catalytic domain-containing protein n=1 Tax=Candolleomyces aberdarensis TaxID=2316362 RepID=A0A4V1Q3E5_9AGAR|nr:hypothetical protein EST38_g7549 [Candolleomyces aberdarensis]